MIETVKKQAASSKWYIKTAFKWSLIALLIGIICGAVGAVFSISISKVTVLRISYPYLLYILPLAGITIVFIYKKFNVSGLGTDDVIVAAREGSNMQFLQVPAIFIGTILTHLCGGSAGREGAALQIGGGIANKLSRTLKLNQNDTKILTRVGMAAFFSALFGTPVAATAFGTMVVNVGTIPYSAVFPGLLASIISADLAAFLGASPERFHVAAPVFSHVMLLKVAVLSVLCAVVSILFINILHFVGDLYKKYFNNAYYKVIFGGFLIIILTIILQTGDYNGAGVNVIERAIEHGQAKPFAFLIKILFTAITLEAGFKGGEVVPSFFIGATFGCWIAPLLGIPAGFGAAIGMIGVFGGATNSFLSPLFLSVEVFQSAGFLYFAVVSIICYLFSGYSGLYSSQRIVYSKLGIEQIDAHPNHYHESENKR
ncbi:chloride channel protein [Eggerthia catenaformis]|mgnify:FL=1|uniref:chloride channel protein n=1 Tax=Eggerthia catenaformis TaxID=31973 RepID=UPI00248E6D56|nr:chloride channel protein [Eggerthia catenaformis]